MVDHTKKSIAPAIDVTTSRGVVVRSGMSTGLDETVKFGDVTILGNAPSADTVRRNVRLSTEALQRVAGKLVRSGVTLPKRRNVPRFSVDENNPDIYIRVLNGKVDRGHMVNGEFEIVE